MVAGIIRGKACRKLYNEGSGWHHLNPQSKHNGTESRTTTRYGVLMGWNRQHPVPHMKWEKKLKLKLDLLIYREKKKKGNRLEDTTGTSWPNSRFRMYYRTNLWASVIKPEAWRKGEGGKDCYKRRNTWGTVFAFWFKQDRAQEDVFGKLRKGQCKLVLFIDAVLRKHLPFVSLDPPLPFPSQPWASRAGRVWGGGAELCGPGNKYSDSTLPPPFDSLLGLPIGQPNWKPLAIPAGNCWPTQLEIIDLPNWKPKDKGLALILDLAHTTSLWDWLRLTVTNNWRSQLWPRRLSATSLLPDSCNHSLPSLPIPGLLMSMESRINRGVLNDL